MVLSKQEVYCETLVGLKFREEKKVELGRRRSRA